MTATGSSLPHDPSGELTWLAGVRLVDIAAGSITDPVAVAVQNGRLTAILDRSAAPTGASLIRLDDHYLLPGLITCHVHLQAVYPYSARDPAELATITTARAADHAGRLVPAGVTTIRTVHEQSQADLAVRATASHRQRAIPHIRAGGRGLTVSGGHADGLGAVVTQGHRGFYRAARAELEAGADHVKVYASGGLARAGESLETVELSSQEMAGAVRAAAERGTYVVAHAASSASIKAGLAAGVRSFEHAYVLDSAAARELADAGAYLTPTLVVTHAADWMATAGFAADAIQRSQRFAAQHRDSIAAAVAAGVSIVHGTDFPPAAASDGTTLAIRELELLAECGLSSQGALMAATATAAKLLDLADNVVRLGVGSPADLVAVASNPLASVSAMREISMVMRAGRVLVPHSRSPLGARQ